MKRAHPPMALTSAGSVSKALDLFLRHARILDPALHAGAVHLDTDRRGVDILRDSVRGHLLILGTFRLDSFPIFTGIQNILRLLVPSSVLPFQSIHHNRVHVLGQPRNGLSLQKVINEQADKESADTANWGAALVVEATDTLGLCPGAISLLTIHAGSGDTSTAINLIVILPPLGTTKSA